MHEAALKLVNAENRVADIATKGFGGRFEGVFVDFHHIANFIHQQADGSIGRADYHIHRKSAGRSWLQLEAPAQIESRDNLPAKINQATNNAGSQWNLRHLQRPDHFLYSL